MDQVSRPRIKRGVDKRDPKTNKTGLKGVPLQLYTNK